MDKCVNCGRGVKVGFHYFCKKCYRDTLRSVKITNADFIDYLNVSFRCNLAFPSYWNFRDMHFYLSWKIPGLKPLAFFWNPFFF